MRTGDRPAAGATILHCGHLGSGEGAQRAARWFKFDGPVRFERPDGTRGEAEWFATCEPCFVERGTEVRVRGDEVLVEVPTIENVAN